MEPGPGLAGELGAQSGHREGSLNRHVDHTLPVT